MDTGALSLLLCLSDTVNTILHRAASSVTMLSLVGLCDQMCALSQRSLLGRLQNSNPIAPTSCHLPCLSNTWLSLQALPYYGSP